MPPFDLTKGGIILSTFLALLYFFNEFTVHVTVNFYIYIMSYLLAITIRLLS